MYKSLTILSISLILCLPVVAEEISATACKHNTAECYEADLDLQNEYIIIKFGEGNYKEFDIESYSPDNLSAYDDETSTYYDIEID